MPVGVMKMVRADLASAGVIACVVIAVQAPALDKWRNAVTATLCIVTIAFGARTWIRNGDWRDDLLLWSATVRTSPSPTSPELRNLIDHFDGQNLAAIVQGPRCPGRSVVQLRTEPLEPCPGDHREGDQPVDSQRRP